MLALTVNNSKWQALLSHAVMCVAALCKVCCIILMPGAEQRVEPENVDEWVSCLLGHMLACWGPRNNHNQVWSW